MRCIGGCDGFSLALHGLRGVAVLFVLVSHIGTGLLPFAHHGIGKVGVWIFFALSAFLLTRGLVAALATQVAPWRALGAYFLHRVCRIYPLLLVVLLLHWVLGQMTAAELGWHVLLLAGHDELWAIPVEVAYYCVIPCLAVLARRVSRLLLHGLAAAMLAVCVGVGVVNPEIVFSNALDLIPRLAPFLLGSLLALQVSGPQWLCSRGSGLWVPAAIWVATMLLHAAAYRGLSSGRFPIEWAPWLSLGLGATATAGIALGLQGGPLSRVLASRGLVFVGRVSFSLYLTHMFVLDAFTQVGFSGGALRGWSALAVCMLVAAVGWHVIERPGIAWGRLLGERLLGVRSVG